MAQTDNCTLEIPLDFSREVTPVEAGMDPRAIARLASLFEAWITASGDKRSAGQLVVLYRGQVAFDRVINADPDTPFLTFSVSKAFTGVCIHRLLEEGRLEWDAPVARYWPEFGCKGKETATIRHVFLHQEGIPGPHLFLQMLMWLDWDLVTRDVARTAAVYSPGSRSEYHWVNYGFIFGKVIENVTGMTFSEYLRQTVLNPLGLTNTWLPIPPEVQRRSPRLFTDATSTFILGARIIFSIPRIQRAIIPAATLHSTARDLAVFYQMLLNGGTYAGRRILNPETIAAATRQGAMEANGTRWAHGFHLGPNSTDPELNGMGWGSTPGTFGHFGLGSCMAWADPDAGLAVAFTCNQLLEEANGDNSRRLASLSDAIWDSLKEKG
jgi:CubicO group peptidase (beta-lactamase class C family)